LHRAVIVLEDAMRLVADRFVTHDDGEAIDLATGLRVQLLVSPAVSVEAQLAWSAACDWFQRLHHPAVAPLVDYGLLGRDRRFEAWQCGPSWKGADAIALATRRCVGEFLQATGLLSAEATLPVHVRRAAPVVIPPCSALRPNGTTDGSSLPLANRGMATIQRPAVPALSEMFREFTGSRPHAAALWGRPGSGKSVVARELARIARVNGFVPLAAHLVDTGYRHLWQGRNVFVIDDGAERGWQAMLQVEIAAPVPHALLIVGNAEVRGVDGVVLPCVEPDQLVAAIVPQAMDAAIERRVRRAAQHSFGIPSRFALSLWPDLARLRPNPGASAVPRVAERAVAYGGDERLEPRTAVAAPSAWPAPGELASWRRRLAGGVADLRRGRQSRGVRQVRQAIGALARRDSWVDAADGAVTLARALLRRGQVREAQKALADAREHATRCGSDATLADVAILSGEAWTDAAKLDEAEAVLAAAGTAAIVMNDRERHAAATLALARCLFWRGRFDEAAGALDRVGGELPAAVRHRRERWRARVAAARGEIATALQTVTGLVDSVSADDDPDCPAATHYAAACVRLMAGDRNGASASAMLAIAGARHAHDPLRAIRARLVLADAERHGGRRPATATTLRRLQRLAPALPPLLNLRVQLLTEVAKADGRHGDEAAALVARCGVPALGLFIPRRVEAGAAFEPLVDEVVAIVRACQTADEEIAVLKDVCARMRRQLHAAAVAIVAGGRDVPATLVGDGARFDVDVAERAMSAGILIQPHRQADRVEAAAPIQYGGATIAALCVRWTLGSTYDHSRASATLATAAAVAAPVIAGAIARRSRIAAAAPSILGVTPAMMELRRQVDRAASAPFPVLIEGESGCGKELVAQAIHKGSTRRDRAFRTLNCAAIPDDLAEAELFGHVRGSFTGAVGDRTGVFEDAHGGTLLLDEIGELSPRAQAKLLRVIQEGEIRRVGENLSRRVDVRIVAATNRTLPLEVEQGRFRADLLYRLDVIHVTVPPLRDRAEDIPLLVEHYWRQATERIGSHATLAAATVGALSRYHWPGNVRELQNVVAALAVRCPRRGVVPPSALPPQFGTLPSTDPWRLDEARRSFEERFIRAALVRSGGHRGRAAVELGVTRQGLTKLMSRLGIS
jgi:DNA-binding NtrC family response regulator